MHRIQNDLCRECGRRQALLYAKQTSLSADPQQTNQASSFAQRLWHHQKQEAQPVRRSNQDRMATLMKERQQLRTRSRQTQQGQYHDTFVSNSPPAFSSALCNGFDAIDTSTFSTYADGNVGSYNELHGTHFDWMSDVTFQLPAITSHPVPPPCQDTASVPTTDCSEPSEVYKAPTEACQISDNEVNAQEAIGSANTADKTAQLESIEVFRRLRPRGRRIITKDFFHFAKVRDLRAEDPFTSIADHEATAQRCWSNMDEYERSLYDPRAMVRKWVRGFAYGYLGDMQFKIRSWLSAFF